jgi:hypothetical protein
MVVLYFFSFIFFAQGRRNLCLRFFHFIKNLHFGVQNYEIFFKVWCFKFFKELIPAIRYIFYPQKSGLKKNASIRAKKLALKNTFTVESYIFDKQKKKKFIRQSNPIKGC